MTPFVPAGDEEIACSNSIKAVAGASAPVFTTVAAPVSLKKSFPFVSPIDAKPSQSSSSTAFCVAASNCFLAIAKRSSPLIPK